MFMSVSLCICVSVYMYMCVVCVPICMSESCVCTCLCACICYVCLSYLSVSAYMHLCVYVYVCMFCCVSACLYVCRYICICVSMCVHSYVLVCVCVCISMCLFAMCVMETICTWRSDGLGSKPQLNLPSLTQIHNASLTSILIRVSRDLGEDLALGASIDQIRPPVPICQSKNDPLLIIVKGTGIRFNQCIHCEEEHIMGSGDPKFSLVYWHEF